MFGISFYEILVIAVIALMFLKPKDMVSTAVSVYKFFGEIKNYFNKLKNDVEKIDVLNNFANYTIEDPIDIKASQTEKDKQI
jgi:sec-independent protein translocase protein TatB